LTFFLSLQFYCSHSLFHYAPQDVHYDSYEVQWLNSPQGFVYNLQGVLHNYYTKFCGDDCCKSWEKCALYFIFQYWTCSYTHYCTV